jgi:hypothetical protein
LLTFFDKQDMTVSKRTENHPFAAKMAFLFARGFKDYIIFVLSDSKEEEKEEKILIYSILELKGRDSTTAKNKPPKGSNHFEPFGGKREKNLGKIKKRNVKRGAKKKRQKRQERLQTKSDKLKNRKEAQKIKTIR